MKTLKNDLKHYGGFAIIGFGFAFYSNLFPTEIIKSLTISIMGFSAGIIYLSLAVLGATLYILPKKKWKYIIYGIAGIGLTIKWVSLFNIETITTIIIIGIITTIITWITLFKFDTRPTSYKKAASG